MQFGNFEVRQNEDGDMVIESITRDFKMRVKEFANDLVEGYIEVQVLQDGESTSNEGFSVAVRKTAS
jgi:hypothetical protein